MVFFEAFKGNIAVLLKLMRWLAELSRTSVFRLLLDEGCRTLMRIEVVWRVKAALLSGCASGLAF